MYHICCKTVYVNLLGMLYYVHAAGYAATKWGTTGLLPAFYTVAYLDGHEVEGLATFLRVEGDDPEDAVFSFTPAGERESIELPYWSLLVPGRKPRKRGRVPATV